MLPQLSIDFGSSSDEDSSSFETLFPRLHQRVMEHRKPRCMHTANTGLRRSPRRATTARVAMPAINSRGPEISSPTILCATSNQRHTNSPARSPAKRDPLKERAQGPAYSSRAAAKSGSQMQSFPLMLRSKNTTDILMASATDARSHAATSTTTRQSKFNGNRSSPSVSRAHSARSTSSADSKYTSKPAGSFASASKTHINLDSNITNRVTMKPKTKAQKNHASGYVLAEARCEADILDSEESEDDGSDTDLSGFVVPDDAELSFHESMANESEVDAEPNQRQHLKPKLRQQRGDNGRRRRLCRGHRTHSPSGQSESDGDLEHSLYDNARRFVTSPGSDKHERAPSTHVSTEVIDLVTPDAKASTLDSSNRAARNIGTNLLEKFASLRLTPPPQEPTLVLPSNQHSQMGLHQRVQNHEIADETGGKDDQFATPPNSPPRSPSRLKSPSKLLSPSKLALSVLTPPHRPSMDGFWDVNEITQWNDHHSPKKVPLLSPNKYPPFEISSEINDGSHDELEESTDDLPSPCESPSKAQLASPVKSTIRAERQKRQELKRAKIDTKRAFDAVKVQAAQRLLHALDANVTGSKLAQMSASTGGVKIVWSKALRSTAGRANWRRIVQKPTGSPVKSADLVDNDLSGHKVEHHAEIELAEKVIDRPERLVNTLAHEFCHLANFMVSGIKDQPHGTSFKVWAAKVVAWLSGQSEVQEWRNVTISTKHTYVIETKYLWVCTGPKKSFEVKLLNLPGETGCGAEYGRHSRSINPQKHRCGICKGVLVQVRPKPRASPKKKMVHDYFHAVQSQVIEEKCVEVIELSP